MNIEWIARALICVVVIASGCTAAQSQGLPQDVSKFIEDRESCEHFADELPPPGQPERLKEVIDKTNLYCAGIDARLDALKAKYAGNAEVSRKLGSYELLGELDSGRQSSQAAPDDIEAFASDITCEGRFLSRRQWK